MSQAKEPDVPPFDGDLKFEDAIEQVESVIERIESDEAGLEQSLTDYERATKLISRCRSILEAAQKRIVELTSDAEGRLQRSGSDGEGSDEP